MLKWLIILLLTEHSDVFGANILAFLPFPTKGHQNIFWPIVKGLGSRGHNVTFVTTIPPKTSIPNVKIVEVDIQLTSIRDRSSFTSSGILYPAIGSIFIGELGLKFGEKLFSLKSVQDIIHSNEKYDAVLMGSMMAQDPVSAFMHKFNAVGIDIIPLGDVAWVNELAGVPSNPSYMIDFVSDYTDQMNFFQRLHNTINIWTTVVIRYFYIWRSQSLMDKYLNYTGWEKRPSILQLISDKALILVNSHHSFGYSFPRAPHIKEIGGVNVEPVQQLPKDLESFMSGAKHGIIYFSFGSNLNFSNYAISAQMSFIKAFADLKQRVIWKWDGEQFPPVTGNVKLYKWLPQNDILAHKNTKLFITHGGMLSLNEAVYHGVPLVCVPFAGDQVKNVYRVTNDGYGIRLDKQNLTEISVGWAINEVLSNPLYTRKAKEKSQLFRDRPNTPLEESMYWIEYVIKHKNVLQPSSAQMPFYQIHMIDIATVSVTLLFVIAVSMYKLLKWMFSRSGEKSNTKTVTDSKKKN